ncbi:ester cyclase [Corallococcus sp. bb12-1]|uniref:ester cyclase n=1 Tax=Corallococcus sp. bb12-1 TaxID=2996784 RepID=UPI00226FDA42|nr:ester cyclase [Corallococcus sp. bb12-1]MCY1044832.1 ester cyclase [Corallococcus sp. bb12-1]
MKTQTPSRKSPRTAVALLALTLLGPAACTSAEEELERYQQAEAQVNTHLTTFDTLDFDVFTHQKWDQLQHSHAQDIIVHWPDGHQTQGIDVHIADLQAMFVYAPDTRIQVHPIRLGSGEWTSVVGIMEGTFTQPMPLPDGTSIAPTGKSIKLVMNTVSRWKDGVMAEEYLFWDNQSYMQQLGLAP